MPVVRDVGTQGSRSAARRASIASRSAAATRTVAPEDLRDFTIMLSNFGTMAGRYATPVVVPPTVAILGTGALRHDVVAVMRRHRGAPAHPAVADLRSSLRHAAARPADSSPRVIEDLQ